MPKKKKLFVFRMYSWYNLYTNIFVFSENVGQYHDFRAMTGFK